MPEERSDLEVLLGPDRRELPRPRGLAAVVAVVAVGILIGLVFLWPRGESSLDLTTFGFADDVVEAEVLSNTEGPCSYAPDESCHQVQFGIEEPEVLVVGQEFPDQQGQPQLEEGDVVFLSVSSFDDGTVNYQYYDKDRRLLLAGLSVVFALAVVALGRLRGLAALVGLALSIAILFLFILPAIIAGRDAVLVALVGGGAIALVSLYLAHGYTPLTHVAAVGAFAALAITTGLSWLVVTLAEFSGLVVEEAFYLLSIPGFDLGGLLLAGIVLGTLGALDDVTVTQASAVWEVHSANTELGHHELYSAGLRVGRDHIASTVNTLLLAYAGASMPLLILFSLSDQPLGIVASSEVVAVEIVRTLVGSIGLVAAVPITTWLGARIVTRSVTSRRQPAETS